MPKFVSILRIQQGIVGLREWRDRVDSQGAMHLIHFLAAKKKGVNASGFVAYSEDDDRKFCDEALKVRPGKYPFFDPLDDEFRIASHFHSNVATMRKKTFADKWHAAEYRNQQGSEEWKFTKRYLDILKEKMLSKRGAVSRVPVFDLCAWLYRVKEFPNGVTLANLATRFKQDYHLGDREYSTIFTEDRSDGSPQDAQGYFVDRRPSDELILELVTDVTKFDISEAISVAGEKEGRSPVRDTDIVDTLKGGRKQVILHGPPGTGKTFASKRVAALMLRPGGKATADDLRVDPAKDWSDEDIARVKQFGAWTIVQFHPSYTYEDFVRGIATQLDGSAPTFVVKDRAFARLCGLAAKTDKPVVLIIDEINRGDLSKVFGELTYALEYRGQAVSLQYADANGSSELTIPENLFLIGTMNTADHSIAHIDYAIRRRFDFIEMVPDRVVIENVQRGDTTLRDNALLLFDSVNELLSDSPDTAVGHSFFLATNAEELARTFVLQVLPLLADYRREGIIQDTDSVQLKGWPGGSVPLNHERPFELITQVSGWLQQSNA